MSHFLIYYRGRSLGIASVAKPCTEDSEIRCAYRKHCSRWIRLSLYEPGMRVDSGVKKALLLVGWTFQGEIAG